MESVTRFWSHEAQNIRCVREADFDRVTAEREALQQRLTKAEGELDLLQAQAVNDTEANTAIRAERDALQLLLNDRDGLEDQLTSLEQRRHAEQQACQAAERDAARYRWLRDVNVGPHMIDRLLFQTVNDDCNPPYRDMKHGVELDAAIDAALNPTAEAVSHDQ